VGMITNASRLDKTQFITFLWLGLNSSCLNTAYAREVVAMSVERASTSGR
jgi:hypothetical protein